LEELDDVNDIDSYNFTTYDPRGTTIKLKNYQLQRK